MNITSTGIAVTLAVVVALGFMFFGQSLFVPFTPPPAEENGTSVINQQTNELMVNDEVVGTGAEVKVGDRVTVTYTGKFENGTVFDASANHPETQNGFSFTLGTDPVIKGWEQGLIGMKVGGKRSLVIPPDLAYGPNDYGPIPGGSTLLFDIELLKVEPGR